jgi:hypothetical protein
MEKPLTLETLGNHYPVARQHIPEEWNPRLHIYKI